MTLNDIYAKIYNQEYEYHCPESVSRGFYPDGYVIDEEKSVKWNREEVNRHNEEIKNSIKTRREVESKLFLQFESDLANAIQEQYNVNAKQAELIVEYAYRDSHAYGYLEVCCSAEHMADRYVRINSKE